MALKHVAGRWLAGAVGAVIASSVATGGEVPEGRQSMVSLGGRLYDNHWLDLNITPPDTRHPRYPDSSNTPSPQTWRCVSCHGWDYRGWQGTLGRGFQDSTRFVSLRPSDGASNKAILAKLKSETHKDMLSALSPEQLDALVMFVSAGQHDTSQGLVNGKSTGNVDRGKDIFEGACVSCHQADGKAYIEGEPGDQPSLGWVANNRPEQALHKIKNGVPGADMLSLRFLPHSDLLDLLAYLQTLDR